MKILRLKCDRIRGVADGVYSFAEHGHLERPHDLVFITGGPSSGKTALLEAIAACKQAVGPYGRAPDPSRYLRPGAPEGSMEATFWLTDQELVRTGIKTRTPTAIVRVAPTAFEGECERPLSRLLACYSHRPDVGKFEYFPANRQLFGEAWRPTPRAFRRRSRR